MRAFQCWRLTRTHHPVNINQRIFTAGVAISRQRVAQMRPIIDIINKQNAELFDASFGQLGRHAFSQLIPSFGINLASRHIHNILGNKASKQVIICYKN